LIWLTRLDGSQILVNDEQITFIELAGETIVAMSNGDRLRVLESPDELTERIVRWRQRVATSPLLDGDLFERRT
jgi:flagellar protein FlbD